MADQVDANLEELLRAVVEQKGEDHLLYLIVKIRIALKDERADTARQWDAETDYALRQEQLMINCAEDDGRELTEDCDDLALENAQLRGKLEALQMISSAEEYSTELSARLAMAAQERGEICMAYTDDREYGGAEADDGKLEDDGSDEDEILEDGLASLKEVCIIMQQGDIAWSDDDMAQLLGLTTSMPVAKDASSLRQSLEHHQRKIEIAILIRKRARSPASLTPSRKRACQERPVEIIDLTFEDDSGSLRVAMTLPMRSKDDW
ncbi:hypothetical protein LTR95_006474 [Oleoguttula sp. CCFEE 5521]